MSKDGTQAMGDSSVDDWLAPTFDELRRSTERLLATVARLTDSDVRAPSGLPGWTRGHLLAHLARNADGLTNLMVWARTGVQTPQYESLERRNGDIEAGAPRNATEQLADLEAASGRLEDEIRKTQTRADSCAPPARPLETMVVAFGGWSHPAWYTLYRRWREVEAHHVDLDAGYPYTRWPDAYVLWDLTESAERVPVTRLRATDLEIDLFPGAKGTPGDSRPTVEGPARELLAWVAGRTNGAALAADGPLPRFRNGPASRMSTGGFHDLQRQCRRRRAARRQGAPGADDHQARRRPLRQQCLSAALYRHR